MLTINFIDRSKSQKVQQGLDFLCQQLCSDGVKAAWYPNVTQAEPGAILLLHDPEDADKIPAGCQVIGQRCLNRRQRLVLAEQCGLPVARWRSVEKVEQIRDIFNHWQVESLLYKADWSYSRNGVKRLNLDDWMPFNMARFNPQADVIMEILTGQPDTYKVDIFYDQVIACRHMHTRSVFDKRYYRSLDGYSELGQIPPLHQGLTKLGKALFNYGQGFSGADVMFDQYNQPWIIELNTSSLGREGTWERWPETYLEGYLSGLRHWIGDGCPAYFSLDGVAPLADKLVAMSGGQSVQATKVVEMGEPQ